MFGKPAGGIPGKPTEKKQMSKVMKGFLYLAAIFGAAMVAVLVAFTKSPAFQAQVHSLIARFTPSTAAK
jgi:hypothetical protein